MLLHAAITLLQTNFSPEERGIPDNTDYPGRTADCVKACNSALQELYGEGGAWMRKGSLGHLLYAPVTVTATATLGSTTVDFDSAWLDWFAGCTCRVSGASVDNMIVAETSAADGHAAMLFPHDGATGAVTVVVYGDSVHLDATVAKVLSARVVGGNPLTPAQGPSGFSPAPDPATNYGNQASSATLAAAQTLGVPQLYTVDTHLPDFNANPVFRLRVSPAPSAQTLVETRVRFAPPTLSITLLNSNIPVPFDAVESIFLPIATQHLTSSQFFRNEAGKQEIARQYATALALAKSARPQSAGTMSMRPLIG